MDEHDIPAPMDPSLFPDEIILYGVKVQDRGKATMPFQTYEFTLEVKARGGSGRSGGAARPIAIAAIYGYAFEGHCYRLDKPKLMVFEGDDEEAKGCGFSGSDYRMWRISRKQHVLEFGVSTDEAEELILEGNKPENRAPRTYNNDMQLAHRGGRLNRVRE